MSLTGTNFGYPSTPVTTELWGKREGEKTYWEGEGKTNVFCVLLPWLAQAYAWNRCSVNTLGMYVQMNEKKRVGGQTSRKGEKDMRVVANISWLCLHNISLSQQSPLAMDCGQPQFSPSLCTGYRHYPSSLFKIPRQKLEGWLGSPVCVQSPWFSQLWAYNILMLVSESSSRDILIKSHSSLWDFLLVLRPGRVADDGSTSSLPFFISHI